MKTVLLFRTSFSPQNRFEYKATFDFASQHDWQIRTVEYMGSQATTNMHRRSRREAVLRRRRTTYSNLSR